jgi:cold shock protein
VARGTVKWFEASNGHGFIVPDEGEKDLWVHRGSIVGDRGATLTKGQRVEFEPRAGGMCPEAINVLAVGQEDACDDRDL